MFIRFANEIMGLYLQVLAYLLDPLGWDEQQCILRNNADIMAAISSFVLLVVALPVWYCLIVLRAQVD